MDTRNLKNILVLDLNENILDNIYRMLYKEDKVDLFVLQNLQNVAYKFIDELENCKANIDIINTGLQEQKKQEQQECQEEEETSCLKKGGYIYFIQSGKYTKIGIASNMKARLKNYRTENPNEIEVLLQEYVSDYRGIETILHNHFKEYNHNREWFEFPEGFDFISKAKQIIKQNNIIK